MGNFNPRRIGSGQEKSYCFLHQYFPAVKRVINFPHKLTIDLLRRHSGFLLQFSDRRLQFSFPGLQMAFGKIEMPTRIMQNQIFPSAVSFPEQHYPCGKFLTDIVTIIDVKSF